MTEAERSMSMLDMKNEEGEFVIHDGARNLAKRWKWIVIAIAVAMLMLVGNPMGTIGAGERGIQLRFNAVTGKILGEGLYFRIPLVERVIRIDIKIQKE